jgi:cold shock protein
MLKKPLSIAIIISLLLAIPLYVLSQQEFVMSPSSLPLVLLSVFIANLLAASLAATAARGSQHDYSADAGQRRESGQVKWFNANKGFGFITRDSGDDVFVHFRSIRGEGHRTLRDGQRVEFAVSEGDKGLQADDVAAVN